MWKFVTSLVRGMYNRILSRQLISESDVRKNPVKDANEYIYRGWDFERMHQINVFEQNFMKYFIRVVKTISAFKAKQFWPRSALNANQCPWTRIRNSKTIQFNTPSLQLEPPLQFRYCSWINRLEIIHILYYSRASLWRINWKLQSGRTHVRITIQYIRQWMESW